jgi:hypothetical protein
MEKNHPDPERQPRYAGVLDPENTLKVHSDHWQHRTWGRFTRSIG